MEQSVSSPCSLRKHNLSRWNVWCNTTLRGKNLSKRMTFSTSGAKRALNWWNAASFLACCSSWILNHFANSPSSTSIFCPRDSNATLAYSRNVEALPARFPTTTCQGQQSQCQYPTSFSYELNSNSFTCFAARSGAWSLKSSWSAARQRRDTGGKEGAAASRERG